MKLLKYLTEGVAWLQIMASPLIFGIVIGGLIYLAKPDYLGMALGGAVALIGLIVGIIWATRVWKKRGTIDFMSRVIATPELDKPEPKS